MDHVVALARGGLHCASNLRPACEPCNLSKYTKLLSELGGTGRMPESATIDEPSPELQAGMDLLK